MGRGRKEGLDCRRSSSSSSWNCMGNAGLGVLKSDLCSPTLGLPNDFSKEPYGVGGVAWMEVWLPYPPPGVILESIELYIGSTLLLRNSTRLGLADGEGVIR